MSYLEYTVKFTPQGLRKILYMNWTLVLLLTAVASVGFMMLFSVSGGRWDIWAGPQFERFLMGMAIMFIAALIPVWFWRSLAFPIYLIVLCTLISVEFIGVTVNGATRWLEFGGIRVQPSEAMKIASVMALAAYYDALPLNKVSHPLWVIIPAVIALLPAALIFIQPDLGTTLLYLVGCAVVVFLAGVHWGYFAVIFASGFGLVGMVLLARDPATWMADRPILTWLVERSGFEALLSNMQLAPHQYSRIETFFASSDNVAVDDYNIVQAKIALGSGGWSGRGYMEGTQTRGNFVPENHTDFILTILAEEFGFIGSMALLLMYVLIVILVIHVAITTTSRFAALLCYGIAVTFFLYFAVNMAMVMELVPVVGLPLPLVSYGGTSMLVLMGAFGLVQSAHVHKPRGRV